MKWIFTFTILLVSIFFSANSYSQYSVKGKIIDGKTKELLAFATIQFNNNPRSVTMTDINGKFSFSSPQKIKTLSSSHIGYINLTKNLDSIQYSDDLLIELYPSEITLQEVIIKPGENPANRIIRKVIANKKINNPEKVSSFKYTSYNKIIYDFKLTETDKQDSLQIKMDEILKGGHILIMESITERKYIEPGHSEELILGTRVSGFKHPSFAPLATDMQPFSFYNDIITIFDINYLNPVSNGSLNKYQFKIEDTIYQDDDTVFIISFKPLPRKNFEPLTGLLYINTNKFAIQNVIAEPFEKGLIDIKIQQRYAFIDNRQWFPEQLNFEMVIRQYPSKKIGISANGKSYIKNVELFPKLKKKEFSLESVRMFESASDRDSTFWDISRSEPLNKKEKITYRVIDSLGEKNKFESVLRLMEKIAQNKIPVKFVDIDLSQTLLTNKFEGLRLGLGLYTNEKVFKYISVGGFFGYGLKDDQWKYGGEFIWILNKRKELKINAAHQNTLVETGSSGLQFFDQHYFNKRRILASRMDRTQKNSLSIEFRAFTYLKLNFSLNHARLTPQYIYEYEPINQQNRINYRNSYININMRYAYKEKFIESLNQRTSMGTKYPIFYISYSKGIKNIFNSDFNYNKIETAIEKSFVFKNLGNTEVRVEGGLIDSPLPYGLLFTGEGSYDKTISIMTKNSFQTVTPYEFLSDRYINFYFSHNFGSILFKVKKFSPHIILHQNIGWGMLSNKVGHQLIEFKSKEKGFYESGFQVDNLIKVNFLNIGYFGFGAGIYYRYGPYAYKNAEDNAAIKFSLIYTTK